MPGEFELPDLLGSWDISEADLSLLSANKAREKSLSSCYKILLQTLGKHSNT